MKFDCTKCEYLMFCGTYHRPECTEQDYLPELVVQSDGYFKPMATDCKYYKQYKELITES